jgi:ribosomal protein S3
MGSLNPYSFEAEKGTVFSSEGQQDSNKLSTHLLVKKLQTKTNNSDVTLNVLSTKLNNIDSECRKIKFIEYLKQIVKKHRTDNIYLYLSTIADARKDLRKLQQFTKRNASFLFGGSLSNFNSNEQSEHVSNVLKNSSNLAVLAGAMTSSSTKTTSEQLSSDIFLEQIEKQRTIIKNNAELTPKIAIKFYSVNSNTLKAKASFVADAVVDALEKRKAFRKVIKDSKEDLMRTSGVKGVKIQLSGRLNGAEIARSEWVRAGRVPLQTLRANIDYSYKTANTIYGIIGIKVWIFKGYTKLI